MAIQWGGYAGHYRIGIDAIISGTNVTLVVYGENQSGYSHQWNSTLTFTGGWGGSKSVSVNVGLGVTRTELHRWSTNYTGSKTFNNSMPIPYWGGTASVSRAVSLSPPPTPKPNAPSGLGVTRVSDTQHTLNWSRNSTYTSVKVYRGTGDGKFAHVGTASGNAYTYTDKGTKANERYYYYVVGVNAGGSSGNSNTAGPVYTTPAAPSEQSATRQASSIIVNATKRPPYATGYDVEDNGSVVASNVSLPWTHAAPSTAVAHRYRIRSRRGSLIGGWSGYTNTVQLLTPPNAPSGLTPNGLVRAGDVPVVLGWKHNPVDASPQSAGEVRWRVDGGAWEVIPVLTADTLAVVLPVGLVEWQVRTKGAHADFGAWSAVATVNVIDRPVVDVTQPGPVWDQPVLRVAWTYTQGQGRPQSAWQAELQSASGAVLESLSGSGAATATTFKERVSDGLSYFVAVHAATGEVWSEVAVFEFRAEFIPPAPPTLIAGWVEEIGAAAVEVGKWPGPPGEPVTNHFTNPNLVGSGVFAEVRRNAQVNPSFEGGFTGHWGSNQALSGVEITADTDNPHSGMYCGKVVANGAVGQQGINQTNTIPRIAPGTVCTFSAWVRFPAGHKFRANLQRRDSSNTYIDGVTVDYTGTGDWQRVHVTRTDLVPQNRVSLAIYMVAASPVTFWIDDALCEWRDQLLPFFSPEDPGDADMRARFLGDSKQTECVLEIETVRDLAPSGLIVGVSTFEGKPAARLIATSVSAGAPRAIMKVPEHMRAAGVAMGTLHVVAPRSGGGNVYNPSLAAYSPQQTSGAMPNVQPGSYPLRVEYAALTTVFEVGFYALGFAGNPDVYWTDPGLYPPGYTGPAFSGDTGHVEVAGSALHTKWDGEPNNSTSTAVPTAAAETFMIERSVDGGVSWEFVADGLTDGSALTDWECLSNGETRYRATAYAATGASSTAEQSIFAESHAVWLSGGESFELAARLPYDPTVGIDAGRERGSHRFAGRAKPISWASEYTTRTITAAGNILERDNETASPQWLAEIGQATAPTHMYRDPTGERMYGLCSRVKLDRTFDKVWSFSFQVEETERG